MILHRKHAVIKLLCITALLFFTCSIMLTGCSSTGSESYKASTSAHPAVIAEPTRDESYDFVIDYYKVPASIRSLMSDEYYKAYKAFVDAYLNYETQSDCGGVDLDDPYFWGIVITCFPIFHADTQNAQYNNGVISWEYTSTAEEHKKLIAAFETQINDYFNCLRQGDSEVVRALALYQCYTSQILYDYGLYSNGKWQADTDFANSDGYHGLMDKTGVCQSFSWAYCFLLTQADIDTYAIAGEGTPTGNHQWSMLKLDGKWYFADPTWDADIKTLKYFGQTMIERENDGFTAESMFYLGSDTYPVRKQFDLADDRFKDLHVLKDGEIMLSYTIDRASNSIKYIVMDSSGKETEKSFPL